MALFSEQRRKTDYSRLLKSLESQELECSGGIGTVQLYSQLLSLYLLYNETCNAKFLWKRIPANMKVGGSDLSQIWAVGQKIWQRDYPGIYETLKHEWPGLIKPIMTQLTDSIRQGAFRLVTLAYSSISADDFATFVGLPVTEAVQEAVAQGWTADAQNSILIPKKPEKVPDPPLSSSQQLSVLTEYVSFLEN